MRQIVIYTLQSERKHNKKQNTTLLSIISKPPATRAAQELTPPKRPRYSFCLQHNKTNIIFGIYDIFTYL